MPINAGSLGNVFIRATRPPQTFLVNRDPTPYDTQGYELLDEWLNTTTNDPWLLVSLKGNNLSRGEVAVWVSMSNSGTVISLTGNSGGPVFVDGSGNINIVGDGTTINIVGVPGTHTLTASTIGTGVISTLTGNSGGAVSPLAGNINVVGDGVGITIVGVPGTHTLTASLIGTGAVTGLLTQDGHTVTPTAGILQLSGSNGIVTTGTIGPNTATITASGTIAQSFITSPATGTATPAAGVLTIGPVIGGKTWNFSAAGSQITLTVSDAVSNVAIGFNSGVSLTGAGTGKNSLYGPSSGFALTSGSENSAYGEGALQNISTGIQNSGFGLKCGANYTSNESANVIFGSNAGTTGESNVMRLGNDGSVGGTTTAKTFISGIAGVTTTVADAVPVLISASTGQLGVTSSSLRYKDNIVDMGSYSDSIRHLRPVVFNYKQHAPEDKSVGLIAEEVAEVAPQLVVYKDGEPETVKYHDLVPMLLNEFQKHCQLIAELQAINADLLNRIRMIEERLMVN